VTVLVLALCAGAAGLLAALGASRYPSAAAGAVAHDVGVESARRSARVRRFLRARRDPAVATGLALSVSFGVVLVAGVVIGTLAYLTRGNDTLIDADTAASRWANHHASPWSTRVLGDITQLGDTRAVVAIGLVVAAIATVRAPSRAIVPFLVATTVGAVLATTALKELADRARPTLNPLARTLGPSFPSGHSSTAACFYAACALVLGRRCTRRARIRLVAAAAALAVAVAASRVMLDVHWVSDVVAGLLLGWAWFALCAVAFGGRLLEFGTPVRAAEAAVAARDSPPAPTQASGGATKRIPGS
jgi:undecaprenyl-diphosphatase